MTNHDFAKHAAINKWSTEIDWQVCDSHTYTTMMDNLLYLLSIC